MKIIFNNNKRYMNWLAEVQDDTVPSIGESVTLSHQDIHRDDIVGIVRCVDWLYDISGGEDTRVIVTLEVQ